MSFGGGFGTAAPAAQTSFAFPAANTSTAAAIKPGKNKSHVCH